MSKIQITLKKVLTNPPILYVLSRYATYIVQFTNSLFIAVYLGPFNLGIWGFINLILGYFSQLNLGISHSVNVIISIEKEQEEYIQKVIGNGLTMLLLLSIFTLLFFAIGYLGIFSIGEKYNFNSYIIPISIIAVITHFNSLLSNVYRVYGNIFAIALNQSLYPFLIIFLIPFLRGSDLLWAMVIANLASVVISLIYYLYKTPIKLKFYFDYSLIKYIQKRGWHLFIYNSSFALIIITTKSFISANYRVEDFGFFTFSYSLANAILLFLTTLSYLVFPKMLNRFASADNKNIQNLLEEIRTAYISTSHILIHFLIMIFPVILLIFPNYCPASDVFKVTALTIVLYTNSFGYQTVLMARGKEKQVAIIAFFSLLTNIFLVPFFIYILKVQFSHVMFATMIIYFIYIYVSGLAGRNELEISTKFIDVLNDIFPIRMFVPFIISIIFILVSVPDYFFIIPFVLYFLLNLKDFREIEKLTIKIIKNPTFINI